MRRSSTCILSKGAYDAYASAVGGTEDETTGLLTISPESFSSLQPLNFNIGGNTYGLTPNAQIWPRALNSAIGGSPNAIYLVVSYVSSSTPQIRLANLDHF